MAAKKNAKSTETATPVSVPESDLGELRLMLLTDIDLSYQNQRTGDWTKGDSEQDPLNDSSFKELVESIQEVGQTEPVTVRPSPSKKGKFQLVKGFRRYAALRHLAELGHSQKTATIKVIVKNLDEVQAFEEHVLENTARDNLKGPDLGFAAYKMQQLHKQRGINMSGKTVAQRMGKNQPYIAQLLRIIERAPQVASDWRDAPVQLSVNEMDRISKLKEPAEQKAEYDRLLKAATDEPDPNQWVKDACTKVEKVATLIGTLEREGLISDVEIVWDEKLGPLGITVKEGATLSQISSIAKAAREAYAKAKVVPEPKAPKARKGKQTAQAASE